MRRRRDHRWLLPIALWASLVGHDGPAQTASLPAALEDLPGASAPGGRPASPASPDRLAPPPPPAPQPIPGPAGVGLPVGGMDAQVPQGLPINLATAMQLSGVRPLDIAAATAQVEQALALLLQAKALWVPNINGGVDYFRHDGVQQNIFTGPNFRKGRQSFFVGGGPSLAVGLADAIFAPLAARRVVASRRADLQAARNDVLFAVAQAYFDLQAARGRLLGVGATIVRAELLVNFAKGLAPSLIPPLEINRAQAELQSLRQTQQVDIRDWRVASARLAEVLLLDPATLLEPIEPPFLQITFVPDERSPDELMPIALNSRPEIASRQELVAAAIQLLRQEKTRPLLPNLVVISPATTTGLLAAGNLSSGPNGLLNSNGSRLDIEVAAVWQLQNGGIGNVGRIRQRRAEQEVAAIELTRTVFRVKSEVSQAVARLQTARVRVVETEEGVRQAIESADKNFIGLRETARPAGELLRLIVRPQEVVAAIIALNTAYEQYAFAIGEYNVAQFEVYRALGQPAQWVTSQAAPAPAPAPVPLPAAVAP
ncbi:MAG: TolC family protein [Planctomycetaceae bacterium]|nr:TolC family protein [Planctomycetaceae bacterium]